MKTILHPAETRGHAHHGWLESYHTFSFAGYYHPERMHFGALRVLNDDRVAPGMGFGMHPHDNMEIISIPLSGDLRHRDSMGNEAVIRQGDIQVMSAGTGIAHSEMNANTNRAVEFLQIWIFPKVANVLPRYDQWTTDTRKMHNQLMQILCPYPGEDGVWIHQDAWFHIGRFDAGVCTTYALRQNGNGVYAFVLDGHVTVAGVPLKRRDGLGISETNGFQLLAHADTTLLLMEVPM